MFKEESRGPAAHPACAKPLDLGDPVTEVLTLDPCAVDQQVEGACRATAQLNEMLTWMESHPFPFLWTANFVEKQAFFTE